MVETREEQLRAISGGGSETNNIIIPKIKTSKDLYEFADKLGIDYRDGRGKPRSTDFIKGEIAKVIWEKQNPGEEMPPQISPMLLKDITGEGKAYTDKHFRKDKWVLQNKINGQRMIMVLEPNGDTRLTSRDRSVKTFRYSELDNHVLGLQDLKSPFDKRTILDGECLYGSSRVLTSIGYLKIEDLFEYKPLDTKVWTGSKWALFNVICRGPKDSNLKRFGNGIEFIASLDHKVLTRDLRFSTAKVGSYPGYLCKTLKIEFGNTWDLEEAYWLGRIVGDGGVGYYKYSTTTIYRTYCTFGIHELADAERFVKWGESLGYNVSLIRGVSAYTASIASKSLYRHFVEELGYNANSEAKTKIIPQIVWTWNLEAREKFLLGYGDADGNKSKVSGLKINIETASEVLAKEVQLLWMVTGRRFNSCHKEYEGTGCCGGGKYKINKVYEVNERGRKGIRVAENCKEIIPVGKRELFTLQVLDEDHSFYADGFIHHNCICDIPNITLPSGITTTSTLQSTVALMHMKAEDALEFQRKNGFSLRYKVFDILMLDGENVESRPYSIRKKLCVKACEMIKDYNPGCAIDILPTIDDYDSAWDEFQKYVESGGEGLILKNLDAPYEQGKRTKGQWKLKGRITIDGFVTGFVPASKDRGLVFSTNYKGKEIEIAAVSNIDMATRKDATVYDENGEPKLNPDYLGRCAELTAQNFKEGSLRLGSARIETWRDDKNPEDCELQEEMIRYDR